VRRHSHFTEPSHLCASREHAVRHAEIRRLALALAQARLQLQDNRAQLLAIAEDIIPGLTSRFGIGPVSAAQAIVSFCRDSHAAESDDSVRVHLKPPTPRKRADHGWSMP